MITEQEYLVAASTRDKLQETINQYFREKLERFEQRMKDKPIFTDEDLHYSRHSLCPCGHGLAYPKDCGPHHYWDCSAILKGTADKNVQHTGQLPFSMWDVKGEIDGATTRGVFRPKVQSP